MTNNKVARGIVLVPCLLLGGAFLSSAVWNPSSVEVNRPLAIGLGLLLLGAGILAQLLPSQGSLTAKANESDPGS